MVFAQVTPAPKPRTRDAQIVGLFFAFLLVVMAVGQLFDFEKFISLLEGYWLPGGHAMATLVAGLLVITEVFALPFLLRMKLSPLMRAVSMVCGWTVVLLWLLLAIQANTIATALTNIGLFGTKIKLMPGWWAVLFAAALGMLAAWTAWGLGPFGRSKHH